MRTTLDIDEDVLEAIKERAQAEKKTAGAVLSELARLAILGPESLFAAASGFGEEQQARIQGNWPTLPRRTGTRRLVTNSLVQRLKEEMELEDGKSHDFTKDGGAG
jgi:hypothetical protein